MEIVCLAQGSLSLWECVKLCRFSVLIIFQPAELTRNLSCLKLRGGQETPAWREFCNLQVDGHEQTKRYCHCHLYFHSIHRNLKCVISAPNIPQTVFQNTPISSLFRQTDRHQNINLFWVYLQSLSWDRSILT